MRTTRLACVVLVSTLGLGIAAAADVIVGTGTMSSTKNIVDNAVNSKDHTVLVTALKAADLDLALKDTGPFTVFAPVNAAFAALPANTLDELLEKGNEAELTAALSYHVVKGRLTFDDIDKQIKQGGGEAKLATLAGPMLTARKNGARNISIKDESGGVANISIYDVLQSNGVVHVIDRVLMMKKK